MSTPRSGLSASSAEKKHSGRPGPQQRNAGPAAPDASPDESYARPRAVPDLPRESIDDPGWDEHMAREVRHQEIIEASFDRAEAYERLGDFEHALEWLDRAAEVSGGLPAAYRARRARWKREPAVRLRPGGGDWHNRPARSGEGGAGL